MDYIILLLGFALLVKGADYFVDGASSIAKYFKIPTVIIGATLVAFGTSAPEASVSIIGSLKNQNGMAIGTVIGSNIFNLLIVVGMAGFIKTLSVKKSIIYKEFPFLILSSVLILILTLDGILSKGDGVLLLILFIIFMYSLISIALGSKNNISMRKSSLHMESQDYNCTQYAVNSTIPLANTIIMSMLGVIGIVLGGQMVVSSGSTIASNYGISDQLIGLTIVAIGTSLPEFITSMVAAVKGETDIALGNIIGSNAFNILFILGVSSFTSPMYLDLGLSTDLIFMIFATILTYIFAFTKKDINKTESTILISLYIVYIYYLLMSS